LSSLVAGEKGKTLRVNAAYDLSAATAFSLQITDPDGGVTVVNSGISVGNVAVEDPDHPLVAFEYIEYITDGTEFSVEGEYLLKLSGDFGADKTLKSVDVSRYVYA